MVFFFFFSFYSCATLLGYPQICEMELLSGMQRDFGRTRGDGYEESAYGIIGGGNQGRGRDGMHAGSCDCAGCGVV